MSKGAVGEEQFAHSAELTQESSVVLTGTLRQDARARRADMNWMCCVSRSCRWPNRFRFSQRTWHGIFDGASPSLAAFQPAARSCAFDTRLFAPAGIFR